MLTNALSGKTPSFDGYPLPSVEKGAVRRTLHKTSPAANVVELRFPPIGKDALPTPLVAVSPDHHAKRRCVKWAGISAEIVHVTSSGRTDYHYRGPKHLLVFFEQLDRRTGMTSVEGLEPSSLHNLTRKLVFVPAGRNFTHWHEARGDGRTVFFYLDSEALPLGPVGIGDSGRPFFDDAALLSTVEKLAALIAGLQSDSRDYLEALGRVLVHELVRARQGQSRVRQLLRGGLASWQQRIVTAYIEEHLAEQIPLATLAELVGLSAYHFCRAFKQSFGLPPHRYHTSRRIEHAKTLLAKHSMSVTDVGMSVGFAETSSFTAAFRKATGLTPSAYHRSLA